MEASKALALVGETSQQRFDVVARQAEAWSKSTIIPKDYAGKPSNCLVALEMSHRTGVPVLAVMQNLHVIQGKPSWSAQFLIAAANASGRFSPLRYRFFGEEGKETWGCRVVANDLRSGEELVGSPVTMAMARAEGWSTKSGSKWITMPEQMLRYRAAAFWARAYAPELAVGLQTVEEVEDVTGAMGALRPNAIGAVLDSPDEDPPVADATDQECAELERLVNEAPVISEDDAEAYALAIHDRNGPVVRAGIAALRGA